MSLTAVRELGASAASMISATYSGREAAAAWLAPISRTCPPRRSAIHRCASGARFVGIPASALTLPLPGTHRAIGAVHDCAWQQ